MSRAVASTSETRPPISASRQPRANAVIYALHVDASQSRAYPEQNAAVFRHSSLLARERTPSAKLLDEFAGASGGALLPVNVGGGDSALDRVLRETSAHYLLGVEPGDSDRDGKAHRLRVKDQPAGRDDREPSVGGAA